MSSVYEASIANGAIGMPFSPTGSEAGFGIEHEHRTDETGSKPKSAFLVNLTTIFHVHGYCTFDLLFRVHSLDRFLSSKMRLY